MPTYPYRCKKCGAEYEVTQRISDPPLKNHTNSKGKTCGPVERLISISSFILKGGGWSRDGYSSSGEPKKENKS